MKWIPTTERPKFIKSKTADGYEYSGRLLLWIEGYGPDLGSCQRSIATDLIIYAGRKGWPTEFEKPVVFPERLQSAIDWPDLRGTVRSGKPWLNGLPRIIFLNDMGDTFTEGLDPDWLAPFLEVMEKSPHQFLVLTKRAQKLADFAERHPLPSNVWPGVSVVTSICVDGITDLA